MLPFFKGHFNNGEYLFTIVGGGLFLGRIIGGSIHYKFKYPVHKKFAIALTVYTVLSVIDGALLFMPNIPIISIKKH